MIELAKRYFFPFLIMMKRITRTTITTMAVMESVLKCMGACSPLGISDEQQAYIPHSAQMQALDCHRSKADSHRGNALAGARV
jgi:hypothetical protein